MTFDTVLLNHAAHMWRVSKSALPPSMQDVLYRDKDWDYQVSVMLQAQDYFMDSGIRQTETKNAMIGVNRSNIRETQ